MKKILIIAKRGMPHLAFMLNVLREESAKEYQIKCIIDDFWDRFDMGRNILRQLEVDYVDHSYSSFEETVNGVVEVINEFSPDLVINDTSMAGGLATKSKKVKMYSVVRRVDFPGYIRSDKEREMWDKLLEKQVNPVLSKFSDKQLKDPRELYYTKNIFVPSIPPFEIISPNLESKLNRMFVGPKYFDIGDVDEGTKKWFAEAQKSEDLVVFITLGIDYNGDDQLFSLVDYLVKRNIRVILTYHKPEIFKGKFDKEKVYVKKLLPVGYISSQVDCVIHHGGHQTSLSVLGVGAKSVIMPMGVSEFEENGFVLESSGVGLCVREVTLNAVYNALCSVVSGFYFDEFAKAMRIQIVNNPSKNILDKLEF